MLRCKNMEQNQAAVSPSGTGTTSVTTKPSFWLKVIPDLNKTLIKIVLLLVFGLDLLILLTNPSLWPFWVEMAGVALIFIVFYYFENRILKEKFGYSRSSLDSGMYALVILRNAAFVLNSIPGVQILGALLLLYGGIPFLVIYLILLSFRYTMVRVEDAKPVS